MKKFYLFAIAALAVVACSKTPTDPEKGGQEPEPEVKHGIVLSQSGLIAQNMSENLAYVVGKTVDNKPFVWDITANEVKSVDVDGLFTAINSDGLAVGYAGDNAISYKGGELTKLSVPAGSYGSAAWDITEDGKMIVGFYYDAAFQTIPCYWNEKGEIVDLPVPYESQTGFELSGAAVRWVSADGSVILGYLLDNFSTWPAAVWNRQSDGSYKCDPFCKDYFEDDYQKGKPYMTFGYGSGLMSLSANGEWATITVQDEYDPWDWDSEPAAQRGARYNFKTKTLEVLSVSSSLSGISNDGLAVGYDGMELIDRVAYYWAPGEAAEKPYTEFFTYDELSSAFACSPSAISADGTASCGFITNGSGELVSYLIY